jgi:hypothetical protein
MNKENILKPLAIAILLLVTLNINVYLGATIWISLLAYFLVESVRQISEVVTWLVDEYMQSQQ